jgi:hypothetical protein
MQFAGKWFPPLDEINGVCSDTPVFILHLHDRWRFSCRQRAARRFTPNCAAAEVGIICAAQATFGSWHRLASYRSYASDFFYCPERSIS